MKQKRQIYDFLGERKPEHPEGSVLLIDPTKKNPVDQIITQMARNKQNFGLKFHPRILLGWWVVGQGWNIGKAVKTVAGRITDILPSRDLLVKTDKGEVQVIPFADVVSLKRNKP